MDSIPLWAHAVALIVLLLISAFFSIAETSMMALNRFRLKYLEQQGKRGAARATALLRHTDRLLGTILLGNNLVNTALTALVTALAIRQFGNDDTVLLIATTAVAFLIIVFCEVTPKVVGATYPEKIALPASFALQILMRLFSPAVWFVNQISGFLLRTLRIDTHSVGEARLSTEELRTIVLESGRFMPEKHRGILVNLFDLEHITVDDVMTVRSKVEALDIDTSQEGIRSQLATCYHNKLPVYEGELNRVVGILHVRRALGMLAREHFDIEDLRELLTEPYFIPSGTPVFAQLQFFQDTKKRLGLVIDEYGEVIGLVTLEDIIEEIIGEFTTSTPGGTTVSAWDDNDEVIVDGLSSLREVNRRYELDFPLDGPRTLNGLLLEHLQELPEGAVSVRLGDIAAEVVTLQGRTIRTVRLKRLPSLDNDTDV